MGLHLQCFGWWLTSFICQLWQVFIQSTLWLLQTTSGSANVWVSFPNINDVAEHFYSILSEQFSVVSSVRTQKESSSVLSHWSVSPTDSLANGIRMDVDISSRLLQAHDNKYQSNEIHLPNVIVPLPSRSNNWNNSLNFLSGLPSKDSKAWNSGKDISLKDKRKCSINI